MREATYKRRLKNTGDNRTLNKVLNRELVSKRRASLSVEDEDNDTIKTRIRRFEEKAKLETISEIRSHRFIQLVSRVKEARNGVIEKVEKRKSAFKEKYDGLPATIINFTVEDILLYFIEKGKEIGFNYITTNLGKEIKIIKKLIEKGITKAELCLMIEYMFLFQPTYIKNIGFSIGSLSLMSSQLRYDSKKWVTGKHDIKDTVWKWEFKVKGEKVIDLMYDNDKKAYPTNSFKGIYKKIGEW